MNKFTLMDTEAEPSEEMLHIIMIEVAKEAKIKMDNSIDELNKRIIKETKEAEEKYFQQIKFFKHSNLERK